MDAGTWFKIITGLIGGIGLFLYGMKLMSDGLQKTAGDRLKVILEKLTSNRFIGTFVGMTVTVLIQSSSATTVMVVGFVNAGMMSLTQALSVVLGANIGTTVTAQIIAFKITAFAGIAVGLGAIMLLFVKKTGVQYFGQILLGFGMLFMGMNLMTNAFAPLNQSDAFNTLVLSFSNYPLLAVLAGTIVTIMLQSSSATIGITIALASTGLIDFQTSVALVLGDNIGTTLTANLAALGGSRTAKQAAFGHFLFNAIGVAYMLVILTPFISLINFITPGEVTTMAADGTYPYMARHIANAHTFFNIFNTILFLPLLPLLAKLCEKIVKSDKEQQYQFTKLSDAMFSTPEIATSQARNEVSRMSTIALKMLNDTETAIQKNDKSKIDKISNYEETLDGFRNEIIDFLDKLQKRSVSQKALVTIEGLRHVTHSLEEIGDQAVKLMKTTFKMLDKKQELTKAGRKELNQMFDAVNNFASVTFSAFTANRIQTEEELGLEDEIDQYHKQFRKNHIKRLNKGFCSVEIGIPFVDILNYLEKIGDHIFSIAQINLIEGKK